MRPAQNCVDVSCSGRLTGLSKADTMTKSEIARLEDAGRWAMAWVPEGYDGKRHIDTVIAAMVPGLALLAIAAALLVAVL